MNNVLDNDNCASKVIAESTVGPLNELPSTDVKCKDIIPKANTNSSPSISSKPGESKRLIRRFTKLDSKKLQQLGLDRKIAEALSHQKSMKEQESKTTKESPTRESIGITVAAAITRSSVEKISSLTKSSDYLESDVKSLNEFPVTDVTASITDEKSTSKSTTPPKITITGPDSPLEYEEEQLQNLSAQQRLENVKQLLNKKIMKKHTKETSPVAADGKSLFVHLEPPLVQKVHEETPKTAETKAPTQKIPKTASTKLRSSDKESLPVVNFLLKNNLNKPVVRPQSRSPSSEMLLKNHSHSKLVLIPKATIRSAHQHGNQRCSFSPINVSKEQKADNSENKCSEATAISSPTASCNSIPKSLIVLENKVLSQHEMIDLTSLGLSTSKVANEGFSQPHKPIPEVVIKQEQPDDFPPLPSNTSNQLNVHPLPIKTNRKIVNTKNLKLSSEKPALASKEARSKSLEKPLTKDQDILSTSSKGNNETSLVTIEKSPLKNCSQKVVSKPEKQPLIKAVSKPSLTSSPSKETNVAVNSMKSDIETLVPFTKSASVEIVNEPKMNDTFSAVDFIASLSNMSQSMTEKSSMELSQEELNLNASCSSMINSATHKMSTSYKTGAESAKSSLPIGKIVTIPKENILKLNPSNLNAIVIASCNGPETIVTKSTEVAITTPNQKLQSMPIKILNKSANVRKDTPKASTVNRIKKTVFKADNSKLRKEMFECLNIKVRETRETSIHESESGHEKSSKLIEFSEHSDAINVNEEPDKSLPKEKVETELQKRNKPSMPSILEANMNVIPEVIQENLPQAKKLDALSKLAEQNDKRSPKMTYVQSADVNIDAPKSLGRCKKSKANLIPKAKPCSNVPKSEEPVNHEIKDLTCIADSNIHQPVSETIRKIEDLANQVKDNRPLEVISVVSPSSEKRLIKDLNINQSDQISRKIVPTALQIDEKEITRKSCGLNAFGEPLEDAGREKAVVLKLQTGLNVNESNVGRMLAEISNEKEKTVSQISKVGLSLKAKRSHVSFTKEPSVGEATPNVSAGVDSDIISDPPQTISNSKLNAKQSLEANDKPTNGNSALIDTKPTKTSQKNKEKKSSPSVALPLTKSPLKRKRPDIGRSADDPMAIASVTHRGKKSNQLKLSGCVKSEENGEEKKKDDEEESLLEPLRIEEFNEYSCKEKNVLNSNKHSDSDSNCVIRRSKLRKGRTAEAEVEVKDLKKMETIGPLSIKLRKGTKQRKELEIEEKKSEIAGNIVKSGEKPNNRRSSQRKAMLEFKEDKSSASNTQCAAKESINYEDLEFLPVNAEIKNFEPLRAKRNIAKKHGHVRKENSAQAKNKKTDNTSREAIIESPKSKRRRKTLEAESETHKVLIDSDSEYEGGEISFEGSPEFLGFDDSFEVGLELKEDDNKFKNMGRKQTNLRDWLTTGKTTSSQALAEEKPCSSRSIPLKKRWDLNMTSRDQTDVVREISSAGEEEVKIKKRKVENLLSSDRKKSALGKNQIEKPEENESLPKPLSADDSEAKACSIVQNVKDIPLSKLESTSSKAQDSTNVKPPPVNISQLSVKDCLQKTFASNVNAEREAKSLKKKSDEKPDNSKLKCESKTASEVEESDLQLSKTTASTKIKSHSTDSPASMSIKSEPNTSATIPVKRGRGRKLGAVPNLENNFNPRLLLANNRSEVDSDEVLTCDAETTGSGPIQCGLCLKRTSSQKWLPHLSEHYGFGFKLGEKELNACNRSIVLSQIISYFKETNIKGLCCRMCQKMYRSGLGLLTHIEGCGITQERVVCEFCKRDYSKLSLNSHLRTCAQRLRLENPNVEENEKKPNLTVEETFSNTGRLKRVSTIKAESKLKIIGEHLGRSGNEENNSEFDAKTHVRYHPPMDENYRQKCSDDLNTFGKAFCPKKVCRFNSDNLDELEKHINTCKHITKSGYYCCFCKMRRFETETLAIEHVEQCHKPKVEESENSDCNIRTDEEDSSDDDNNSISEDADENEDNLEENSTKKSAKKNSKMKPVKISLERNKVFAPRSHDVDTIVMNKWKNFLKINYSLTPLFSKFSSKFRLGNFSELSNYFPRQKTSMKFAFLKDMKLLSSIGQPKKDMEWSELKRFENVENESEIFFFLGAPVKIVAWVPLPHDVSEQYLAVVYRKDMFKYTRFSEPKRHNTLLLLFKVLQTESEKVSHLQLHYGVNITDGPIHHISFIPSGGYNADDNRLALVAVGGVESTIKVYALPLKIAANVDEAEPIIIEIESSFILKCGLNDEDHIMYKTQCLQICWSEVKGHNHIFAAYSNGCIGIWDISDDMQGNLNCFLIDNVHHYVPLNYWYVGEKGIKNISIHYDTNGPRWLAVSGMLRRFAVFDIRNIMHPTVVRDELNKNIVRAMDWCPVWETILLAICDSIPNNGRCAITVNPVSVMFAHNKLDIMSSAVTQVHYTPLTNLCVCSTDNGDLLFLSPRELHYERPLGKQFGGLRRFLTTMDVKTLNGDPLVRIDKNSTSELPNDWNMYEKNYKYKYGLVFGSIFPLKAAHKSAYLDENRRPPLHITPLMRINTLRCNLNPNGKHLTAVGYENGFVRIVNFQKDSQLL